MFEEVDDEERSGKNHHSHTLVKKIRDRKVQNLVLKMPKSSVYKVLARFSENLEAEENSETHQLAETIYDVFLQKYGLQNVADIKYKRFLVALRMYAPREQLI